MDIPSYLAGLNPEQLAAAIATEGYCRVVAGAGTGKTRLLTHRYAYLVCELGIDPADIACVTFTNRAAAEMRRRIRSLIGEVHDTSFICTYHSLAAHILRQDIDRLQWPRTFQILDRDHAKDVLAELYAEEGLKLGDVSFESVLETVGNLKGNPAYLDGMLAPGRCHIAPKRVRDAGNKGRMVEAFLQRQKRDYLLDFDDLLMFVLELLKRDPEVRLRWQTRIAYLMVDEYQDSDPYEAEFADILAGYHTNLMVVGDPDQNIYEWNGADVHLMVDFDHTHVPCSSFTLTRNYRSTPQVLTCANELIAHNAVRLPKDLVAERAPGAPVIHMHAPTDAAETSWIADRMTEAHEKGMAFDQMAVLFRSAFASRAIEKRLMERGIPYTVVGSVRFMRHMEVADAVAYLSLVAYGDDISFRRVVNVPRRKMGKSRLAFLEDARRRDVEATGEPRTLLQTLQERSDDAALRGSGARGFLELMDDLRSRMDVLGVADLVDLVLEQSGYQGYLHELGSAERLDNLAEFKRMVHGFEADAGEDVTLYDLLDSLALQTGDDDPDEVDRVRLMTIHAAKGLEFGCVYLVGMSEDVFPNARTLEERGAAGLEEERRLCYVALTRARDLLVMTDSEVTSAADGRASATHVVRRLPSRFLWEMGPANYVRVGTVSPADERRVLRAIEGGVAQVEAAGGSWEGMRVIHPVFGAGTIVGADEGAQSWTVTFDGLPTPRHLTTSYLARLVQEQTASASVAVDGRASLPAGDAHGLPAGGAQGPDPDGAGQPALEPEVEP